MAMKADQSFAQSDVTSSSASSLPASSPRVSMFGAKAGFVIPKNKLSGSMVRIIKPGKNEDGSTLKEYENKPAQRKTNWGPDLAQDPVVKKGRLLAYQTRLEQITKQLKSGALDIDESEDSLSPMKDTKSDITNKNIEKEWQKHDTLELEKREIIGEILQLNPNYKPPADYKPVPREEKVPIPAKDHPGFNFVALLLGPESNNKKRLQEETGAKLRVCGTNKATRQKHELTQADANEAHNTFEDLYVEVSADTFDKVDAAVALLELLLTPVPVTPSASSAPDSVPSTSALTAVDVPSAPLPSPLANRRVLAPYQPFSVPWFSPVQPSISPIASSGMAHQLQPNNPSNFRPPVGSFSPATYTGQPPNVINTQRAPFLPGNAMQPPQGHYSVSSAPPITTGRPPIGLQPLQTPLMQSARPPMPMGPPRWQPAAPIAGQLQGPPQIASSLMPLRPPISVSPVTVSPLPPATNTSPSSGNQPFLTGSAPSMAIPSRPLVGSSNLLPSPQSIAGQHHVPLPAPSPVIGGLQAQIQGAAPAVQMRSVFSSHVGPLPGRPPVPQPVSFSPVQASNAGYIRGPSLHETPAVDASGFGVVQGFSPSAAIPRPPRPMPGDFTFQPLRSPSSTFNSPQITGQFGVQIKSTVQEPPLRPVNEGSVVPLAIHELQRPQDSSMGMARATFLPLQSPPSFPRAVIPSPMQLTSPNASMLSIMAAHGPQLSVPSLNQISSVPPPQVQFLHQPHSPLTSLNRPRSLGMLNHQFSDQHDVHTAFKAARNLGGNQVYDPFSPTAISGAPSKQPGIRNPEGDPEYEDLMSSVGVK